MLALRSTVSLSLLTQLVLARQWRGACQRLRLAYDNATRTITEDYDGSYEKYLDLISISFRYCISRVAILMPPYFQAVEVLPSVVFIIFSFSVIPSHRLYLMRMVRRRNWSQNTSH